MTVPEELWVDPLVLRGLATDLGRISEVIEGIDPRGLDELASAMPGSDIGRACADSRDETWQALSNCAKRVGQMGFLVRGAGDDYQATDSEIGTGFTAMGDLP